MARKGTTGRPALSPQCRDPNKLCPCVRRRYLDLCEACKAAGITLTLIETLRQPDRQAHYVNIGVSWTLASKHLPQPPNDLSLAFDVCPTAYLRAPRWNPAGEDWRKLRDLAKSVGLRNGGDWRGKKRDWPHCYVNSCRCHTDAVAEAA